MFQAGLQVALDVLVVRVVEFQVAKFAVGQITHVLLLFNFARLMFALHVSCKVLRVRKYGIANMTLHLLEVVCLADLLVPFEPTRRRALAFVAEFAQYHLLILVRRPYVHLKVEFSVEDFVTLVTGEFFALVNFHV